MLFYKRTLPEGSAAKRWPGLMKGSQQGREGNATRGSEEPIEKR